jgi:hypothetical protein
LRAESGAIFSTQRFHGKRKKDFLDDHFTRIDFSALEKGEITFSVFQFRVRPFPATKDQAELRLCVPQKFGQAPGADQLNACLDMPYHKQVAAIGQNL